MRAIEFTADEPGDWAIHCHKSHHTMNSNGPDVKTFIGVPQKDLTKAIQKLVPDYMAIGLAGHGGNGRDGDAAARQHAADDDRLGQYGPVEMGGMFSVVKVREGPSARD